VEIDTQIYDIKRRKYIDEKDNPEKLLAILEQAKIESKALNNYKHEEFEK